MGTYGYERCFGFLVPATGLICLAIFNDKDYWALHMVGVATLGYGVYHFAYTLHPTSTNKDLFLVAISLYTARIFMKIYVVLICEIDLLSILRPAAGVNGGAISTSIKVLWPVCVNLLMAVFHRIKEIMMEGNWNNHFWTPLIFKFAAILQWIVLIICFRIIDVSGNIRLVDGVQVDIRNSNPATPGDFVSIYNSGVFKSRTVDEKKMSLDDLEEKLYCVGKNAKKENNSTQTMIVQGTFVNSNITQSMEDID